jgi:hypothetical protein
MAEAAAERTPHEAVAAYKRMLAAIIDKRPSGTRQRLAGALAKNRSFVSQITNPAYATPIPASHLGQIFEICHFSAAERQEFTRLYGLAHPKKMLAHAPRGHPPCIFRTLAMRSATGSCTGWSAPSCGTLQG